MSTRSRWCTGIDIGGGVVVRAELTKPRDDYSDDEWEELRATLRAYHSALKKVAP